MNRFALDLLVLLVLAGGCADSAERGSGEAPEDPTPEPFPPIRIDAGFARTPPVLFDAAPAVEGPRCFRAGLHLPPDCRLAGEWRLSHSQPDSPCPFGASRHSISLYEGGTLLCLQPGDDFQMMEPGTGGTCSVVLSGQHPVPAASDPYVETWTSWLTFTGDGGSGETRVTVNGGSNCMRKFQTTIERK